MQPRHSKTNLTLEKGAACGGKLFNWIPAYAGMTIGGGHDTLHVVIQTVGRYCKALSDKP